MTCGQLLATVAIASLAIACAGLPDTPPKTSVVLENHYAPATSLVVYDAFWLDVSFQGIAVAPGASSDPQPAIPASADNTAYVVLAPGWDSSTGAPPTQLVLLESRGGFAVALGDTLHIAVSDEGFAGNCATGSHLTQDEADFLTQIVFASDFAGQRYDAATCTTTPIGDAGAP